MTLKLTQAVALSACVLMAAVAAAQRPSPLSRSAEIIGVAKRPGLPKSAAADRVFVEGATIIVRRGSVNGPEFIRAKSDGRGRFMIPVPPGTYYLIPLSPAGDHRGPAGKPLRVVAVEGRTKYVTLFYPRR